MSKRFVGAISNEKSVTKSALNPLPLIVGTPSEYPSEKIFSP